jgi:uncharacterized membrane protein
MIEVPSGQIRKVKADLVEISGRLGVLARDFQELAAALPSELQVGEVVADSAAAPIAVSAAAPPPDRPPTAAAPPAPPAPPAVWAPPPPPPVSRPMPPPPPPTPPRRPAPIWAASLESPNAPARRPEAPVAEPRPGRKVTIAEIFSILGSAITLLGVAFVLLLPADGVLTPVGRASVGLGLAAVAVLVAVWQHRAEPGNIGSQALMATGVAAAFLSVFAISSLFRGPDGAALIPPLVGVSLAGVISLGGVAVARWWRSQWLAVLAVLGSLLLAPYLGAEQPLWTMSFMLVMTLVTAAFQHKLDWVALLAARVLPTTVYFAALLLPVGRSSIDPLGGLALAFVLAAGGLGIAVLHQNGAEVIRAVAVGALVAMTGPMMLAIWTPDRLLSVALSAALGLVLASVGLLPRIFTDAVRAASVPLGAVFVLLAVVRFTDGKYLGYVLFAMAAAYFAVAASTRFRPVLVVSLVLAALGALHWLPTVVGLLRPSVNLGVEAAVESTLGLLATLLCVRALRAFWEGWGSEMVYLSWVAAMIFGSSAVIAVGTVLGVQFGALPTGFQAAHAVVTVSWLLFSVYLLRRGLRSDTDALVAVRLAIGLAAAAVIKLFLFDLSTLPDLVRALAFLAVGVVMLVIGTWYHQQLEKVRRDPEPVEAAVAAAVPASPDAGVDKAESPH